VAIPLPADGRKTVIEYNMMLTRSLYLVVTRAKVADFYDRLAMFKIRRFTPDMKWGNITMLEVNKRKLPWC